MNVETILRIKGTAVATVRPDETVGGVAQRLKADRIGALVVSEDGQSVLGIISERDIVQALADHAAATPGVRVADIMTRKVVTCTRADSVGELMQMMTKGRFRHVPVVEDGRLAGIISIGDVVKHRLDEVQSEAEALREFIIGS